MTMPRRQDHRSRLAAAVTRFCLVAFVPFLIACSAKESHPEGSGGGGGVMTGGASGGAPSSGSVGGSASAGTGGAGQPTVGAVLDCAKPNLGSPTLRLLTRNELESTLGDIFPQVSGQWSDSLPAADLSAVGFDNDESRSVGKQFASGLLDTAQSVATAITGAALANVLPCSAAAANRACAEQFLVKYGRRLFRRPLTAAEHDRFLAFFDASLPKSDFKTALKWMTVGLIQSPSAIYRSEMGTMTASQTTRQLSPQEIATSLAYTYTGSTPSEELLAKADAGALGDLATQARTMMSSEAGARAFQRFFEGYLGYTSASSVQRPNIPSYGTVSADMIAETRAFINDVLIVKKGGLKELLTAPSTNPSKALASYYGFPAPAADYASVNRPAGRGIGVLAQGAFLATHASPDSSSPTKRGLLPFYRLLCRPKLTPPPTVPQIGVPQPGQKTTRQRYEEAHAAPGSSCAFCHHQFDPIGFGFEHYDEGGRYRETEGGLAINAASTVPKEDTPTPFSFTGQEDLMTGLASQPIIHQCVAAYLATYAFGSADACLGMSSVPDLQANNIGLVEAFVKLASEPHFTQRNTQ
jgi:hypothetical protein